MEARITADALLRLRSHPFPSSLTPVPPARWSTSIRPSNKRIASGRLRRNISTTSSCAALKPSIKTTAAPANHPHSEDALSPISSFSKPVSSLSGSTSSTSSSIDEISRSLGWTTPKLPPQVGSQSPSTSLGSLMFNRPNTAHSSSSPKVSASDIISSIHAKSNPRTLGSRPHSGPVDVSRMMLQPPESPFSMAKRGGSEFDSASLLSGIEQSRLRTPRTPLMLRPSTGRSVNAGPGNADVPHAFQLVNATCIRNGVKRDFQAQRYHERPGLKRKRLKRLRHRRRFLEGFKATCQRVREMARMGW